MSWPKLSSEMPGSKLMKKSGHQSLPVLALMLVAAVLLALRLTDMPPPWFDEGWVLSVARNWAVIDHYGQLRNGEPIVGNLPSVGIPAIASIALSFRAFGIGVWQGRLPGILFTLAALWFLCSIASRVSGRDTAFWTLFAALFMSTLAPISPLIIGRQALGEMPGLCLLLGGYLVLCHARQHSWLMILVSCLWGLTVATKLLFLPFLAIGSLLPAVLLTLRKRYREGVLFFFSLAGALAVCQSVALLESWLQGRQASTGETSLQFIATAFVPVLHVRIAAFRTLLLAAMPTVIGLLAAVSEIRRRSFFSAGRWHDFISLSLLTCVMTWITWYLLMSYGWPRYVFPPLFIGSMFLGAVMARLTSRPDANRRDLPAVSESASGKYVNIKGIIAQILLAGAIPLSLFNLYSLYMSTPRSSLLAVVEFLNSSTPADSLIETYDMELLFLLNRRYHYPSEDIQISLNRRTFEEKNIDVNYDPLRANPDYLVVGTHGALWHLYDPVIEAGHFRLLRDYPPYRLYVRAR